MRERKRGMVADRTRAGDELFEGLCASGIAAFEGGQPEEALDHFSSALEWAESRCRQDEAERARCYRCWVTIKAGASTPVHPELRDILLSSTDEENRFLAAYYMSISYEDAKDHRKGLFYARLARDGASRLGGGRRLAASLNQIGNHHLAQSYVAEAMESYGKALEALGDEHRDLAAVIRQNLGYAMVLDGDVAAGLALLEESLNEAVESPLLHLDLCFAYLEEGRLTRARAHGEQGLRMAREARDQDLIKNGLFLLGEVARLSDDDELCRHAFSELEELCQNGMALQALLVAVGIRKMVNLRA